jgi:hypothetical protein
MLTTIVREAILLVKSFVSKPAKTPNGSLGHGASPGRSVPEFPGTAGAGEMVSFLK